LISSLSDIGPDLEIRSVDFEGDTSQGSTLRMEMQIFSAGEQIDVPFNVTISIVQNEITSVVGRELISSIAGNAAVNIRAAITVPDGDWTLLIEVDAEQSIWELDEMNNEWLQNYSQQSDGMSGTLVVISAGGGVFVLIGVVSLLLRKRGEQEGLSADSHPVTPITGPPSRADGTKKAPSNLKGPPPKAQVDAPAPEVKVTTSLPEVDSSVSDYSQLPGGGEYRYEGSQTFYSGTHCGSWKQNPDQSFTRME
jgi:hypothetical protein